jgi:hypothetical protein
MSLCTGPHQCHHHPRQRPVARTPHREKAALEREDAERADPAREQARTHSWRCRDIAELYDDSFRSFGVTTPSQ